MVDITPILKKIDVLPTHSNDNTDIIQTVEREILPLIQQAAGQDKLTLLTKKANKKGYNAIGLIATYCPAALLNTVKDLHFTTRCHVLNTCCKGGYTPLMQLVIQNSEIELRNFMADFSPYLLEKSLLTPNHREETLLAQLLENNIPTLIALLNLFDEKRRFDFCNEQRLIHMIGEIDPKVLPTVLSNFSEEYQFALLNHSDDCSQKTILQLLITQSIHSFFNLFFELTKNLTVFDQRALLLPISLENLIPASQYSEKKSEIKALLCCLTGLIPISTEEEAERALSRASNDKTPILGLRSPVSFFKTASPISSPEILQPGQAIH